MSLKTATIAYNPALLSEEQVRALVTDCDFACGEPLLTTRRAPNAEAGQPENHHAHASLPNRQIPAEHAHFERFYRVDTSRSRAFGGSGIGLTIVQSLAQAMEGDVSIASAGLNHGSNFTLTLPQVHT